MNTEYMSYAQIISFERVTSSSFPIGLGSVFFHVASEVIIVGVIRFVCSLLDLFLLFEFA